MTPRKFFLNGKWYDSKQVKNITSPYDGRLVGQVYMAGATDIADAIESAAAAFRKTSKTPSYLRSESLTHIADAIDRRREEIAGTITAETGKPITFSKSEVERSILTFRVAAQEALRIGGEVLPLDLAAHSERRTGIVRRFPLGPIGAITPFNFPMNLVAHKVAPAIAAGNSIVLKPSSMGIQTALILAEIIAETSLPPGAFNILPCASLDAAQLIEDERIKLISFTGSPAVGWGLKARAGKKRVVLELGGNAAVIVDKGVDLDAIVPRIVLGSYGNAGQSCIAVQRIYVHNDLYPAFEAQFVKATGKVAVGDPTDPVTVVGPMIDERSAQDIQEWINEAISQGARLLCGGGRKGAVLEPTVLTGTTSRMKVCSQEVFAPVVTVESFNDFKESLEKVNDSSFGLQAGVFTESLTNAFLAYEHLEVGGVVINDYPTYRIDHMPYGGVKDSGFGREGIRYAIEEMTEMKLLVLNFS